MLTTEMVNKFTQGTQIDLMSLKLDVLDLVRKLLKAMFVEVLRPDVGELVLGGHVMDGDLAFIDKLTNVEEP